MNMPPRLTLVLAAIFVALPSLAHPSSSAQDAATVLISGSSFDLPKIERPRILAKAKGYLTEAPITVTAATCERSAGGKHDFYSEGDYWWPNPEDPDGPYIRRDGETNPENFIDHRLAMIRLSDIIGTLTSAYLLTEDETYAAHAVTHLKAWFVNAETRMNPNLLYGQAIKGRHTGRSIGIIDTCLLYTSPSPRDA